MVQVKIGQWVKEAFELYKNNFVLLFLCMVVLGILSIITLGIVAVLGKQNSVLLEMKPTSKPLTWLWAGLGALILLSPIGILAQGTAWGEWGADELKATLGFVPAGLEKLGGVWTAAMPDYAPTFIKNPYLGYMVAAVVGCAIIAGITWLLGKLLAGGSDDGTAAPHAG